MAIYSEFSHEKLSFSIAMLVHQRVPSGNETWQKIPVKISINGGQPSKKSSMFQQSMFDDTGLQNQAELITRGYSHCSCGPQHGILWNRRFPCSILYLWDPCWFPEIQSESSNGSAQHWEFP